MPNISSYFPGGGGDTHARAHDPRPGGPDRDLGRATPRRGGAGRGRGRDRARGDDRDRDHARGMAAAAGATTAARDRPRPEGTAATGRDRGRGIAAAGADRGRGLRETEGGAYEIIRESILVHFQSGELISSR